MRSRHPEIPAEHMPALSQQDIPSDLQSPLRRIRFLTDMCENDLLRPRGDDPAQDPRTVFIAQMTAVGCDPVFDICRASGMHKHLQIMIALQNDVIRTL